jgi:hypothetical protein
VINVPNICPKNLFIINNNCTRMSGAVEQCRLEKRSATKFKGSYLSSFS